MVGWCGNKSGSVHTLNTSVHKMPMTSHSDGLVILIKNILFCKTNSKHSKNSNVVGIFEVDGIILNHQTVWESVFRRRLCWRERREWRRRWRGRWKDTELSGGWGSDIIVWINEQWKWNGYRNNTMLKRVKYKISR